MDRQQIDKDIELYTTYASKCNVIDSDLYSHYEVKRGLRDISGKGVVAGLTEISEVRSYIMDEGDLVPCDGKLYYRGYNVEDLVSGFIRENRFGFEEVCYLLLFGHLPNQSEYDEFRGVLSGFLTLPDEFLRDTIMNAPSKDMMNSLATSVLTLYTYDPDPENISIPNVISQCLQLIARFPPLMVYAYQSFAYYYQKKSLFIHTPKPELSTAENILYMLRPDSSFTPFEARVLDLALVLHAEHGGGNNSTFTTHVVTSSGTDTYSSMVASLSSLKGPKHGGANIKVVKMFDDMKKEISDWTSELEICDYLNRILDKKAFDCSGLIYGIGHAVYSLSDPRAVVFKKFVEKLAEEKGLSEEFKLYSEVERLAPIVISGKRKMYKGVSANVDFYSGFVYRMLGLPEEIFTPLFACARVAGWSAHRIEELVNGGKIIRPAYKSVAPLREYMNISERS